VPGPAKEKELQIHSKSENKRYKEDLFNRNDEKIQEEKENH